MLGKPKFKLGDRVKFSIHINSAKIEKEGEIDIVDNYGTFCERGDVSYDILCNDNVLYKHISEKYVHSIDED